MTECTFCSVYEKKQDLAYESNNYFARFDKYPISPGHALIIPKKHIVSLLDLNIEEWSELKSSIDDVVKLVNTIDKNCLYEKFIQTPLDDKSLNFCQKMMNHVGISKKPDGYNIGNNEGEAAGRTVHHLHIHIIPRYFGDVEDPRGGIRHIIPELGNYKK